EDGIRDRNVTGVQTCALPIWLRARELRGRARRRPRLAVERLRLDTGRARRRTRQHPLADARRGRRLPPPRTTGRLSRTAVTPKEIGRASCREREEITVVARAR